MLTPLDLITAADIKPQPCVCARNHIFLTFHQPPVMNSQVLFGLSAKYIGGFQMQLNPQ